MTNPKLTSLLENSSLSFEILIQNGVISDRILFCISQERGGHQTFLNLRKVCSATKTWIDSLHSFKVKKWYPELQVSIFLCRRTLAEFVVSSPQFNVSSLNLRNSEYLHDYSDHKEKYTVEEKKYIELFVKYWLPKLELLDSYDTSRYLFELFGPSPGLKSICCEFLHDVPKELVRLENILMRNLGSVGYSPFEEKYFEKIVAVKYLKKVDITGPAMAFKGLTILIESRTHDKQFSLTVNMTFEDVEIRIDLEVLKKFVNAVVKSSSSIRLMRVSDFTMSKILQATQDKVAINRFFLRVYFIQFQFFETRKFIVDLMQLYEFTNLKRFEEEYRFASVQRRNEIFGRVEFSNNIQELSVSSLNYIQPGIPNNLKYLALVGICVTFPELQDAVNFINDNCPVLEKLTMDFWCESPAKEEEHDTIALSQNAFFTNLSSLSLFVKFRFEDTVVSSRIMLLDTFKINTLRLRCLNLEGRAWEDRFPLVLSSGVIRQLLAGPLADSLVSFFTRDVTIEENATEELEKLNTIVESNYERDRQRYGRQLKVLYMDDIYTTY